MIKFKSNLKRFNVNLKLDHCSSPYILLKIKYQCIAISNYYLIWKIKLVAYRPCPPIHYSLSDATKCRLSHLTICTHYSSLYMPTFLVLVFNVFKIIVMNVNEIRNHIKCRNIYVSHSMKVHIVNMCSIHFYRIDHSLNSNLYLCRGNVVSYKNHAPFVQPVFCAFISCMFS